MRRRSLLERVRLLGRSAIDVLAVLGRSCLFLFHALVDTPIQDRIRAWRTNRSQLRSRLMAEAGTAVPLKG